MIKDQKYRSNEIPYQDSYTVGSCCHTGNPGQRQRNNAGLPLLDKHGQPELQLYNFRKAGQGG